MLGLVGEIQQVELVSKYSQLEHLAGSGLIAIAAILAAGLAAWVAVRNTRHQLAHDQRVRNREHIRDAIDEAAAAFEAARTGGDKLLSAVKGLEILRKARVSAAYQGAELRPDNWNEPEKETLELGQKAREEAYAGLFRMEGSVARLELRLDKDDPIISSYEELRAALLDLVQKTTPGLVDDRVITGSPQGDERRRNLVKVASTTSEKLATRGSTSDSSDASRCLGSLTRLPQQDRRRLL